MSFSILVDGRHSRTIPDPAGYLAAIGWESSPEMTIVVQLMMKAMPALRSEILYAADLVLDGALRPANDGAILVFDQGHRWQLAGRVCSCGGTESAPCSHLLAALIDDVLWEDERQYVVSTMSANSGETIFEVLNVVTSESWWVAETAGARTCSCSASGPVPCSHVVTIELEKLGPAWLTPHARA